MIITLVPEVSPRVPVIQTIEFSSMYLCNKAKEAMLKDYKQNFSDCSHYSVVCVSNL